MPAQKPLKSVAELVTVGLLPAAAADGLAPVAAQFAIGVSPAMAAIMRASGEDGPVRRQFIPDRRELTILPSELHDPIGDETHSPLPGLVHRYPDRVLFKLVSVCPVYCRFCFRREMVGPDGDGAMSEAQIEAAAAYVEARPAIREVILTGGDPFMLAARRVRQLMERLNGIAHLDVIRWHTRVPVVAPERLTAEFVAAVSGSDKIVVVGVHCNHADELGPEAEAAIRLLRRAGVSLVSQTVLLKGINDTLPALETLMRAFLRLGIRPYYLHHGDLAKGTSHFRTSLAEGLDLVEALRGRLSGLAQPIYVLDLPGGAGKVPVTRALIAEGGARNWTGDWHAYPPAGAGG
ncbi:MAG: lysine-2,3-aminomutase-like protein [Hyphomicrobiales bacterium]|nr:MAG: lysine-2,3-aminomutase-like protein [Hyphomicrobiales bacterium]